MQFHSHRSIPKNSASDTDVEIQHTKKKLQEKNKKKTDVLPALESASASELKIHAESQPYTIQNILQQQQQQKTPKRLNAAATPPANATASATQQTITRRCQSSCRRRCSRQRCRRRQAAEVPSTADTRIAAASVIVTPTSDDHGLRLFCSRHRPPGNHCLVFHSQHRR